MPTRVGKLDVLQLAVYGPRASDGSYWFNDDGRIDVHGNTKWTTNENHPLGPDVKMKGSRPIEQVSRASHGFDEDMRRAIAASMAANTRSPAIGHNEANDVAAAIAASPFYAAPSVTLATPSDPRPTEAGGAAPTCSICMDALESGVKALRCGHAFHAACVDRWLRISRTCPTCRETA